MNNEPPKNQIIAMEALGFTWSNDLDPHYFLWSGHGITVCLHDTEASGDLSLYVQSIVQASCDAAREAIGNRLDSLFKECRRKPLSAPCH